MNVKKWFDSVLIRYAKKCGRKEMPTIGGGLLRLGVYVPVDGFVREGVTCFSVDVQRSFLAPNEELLWVKVGSDDGVPFALELAAGALGVVQPVRVPTGKFVAVLHDGKDALVGFCGVPGDSDAV
jgi:hypothetical protein